MSIQSNTFGRVKLTNNDARKFRNQVVHGRPKAAAVASVRRGMEMSRKLSDDGKLVLVVKPKS